MYMTPDILHAQWWDKISTLKSNGISINQTKALCSKSDKGNS
jgi:hypothetical protein